MDDKVDATIIITVIRLRSTGFGLLEADCYFYAKPLGETEWVTKDGNITTPPGVGKNIIKFEFKCPGTFFCGLKVAPLPRCLDISLNSDKTVLTWNEHIPKKDWQCSYCLAISNDVNCSKLYWCDPMIYSKGDG